MKYASTWLCATVDWQMVYVYSVPISLSTENKYPWPLCECKLTTDVIKCINAPFSF